MRNSMIKGKLEALMNIQTALNEVGYSEIKSNFVNYNAMLAKNITKPSEAEFRHETQARDDSLCSIPTGQPLATPTRYGPHPGCHALPIHH